MAWNRHFTDAVTEATSRRWRERLKFNFHTEADGVGATPLNIEIKPKKNSATFWASALDFCVTAKNWNSESVAR